MPSLLSLTSTLTVARFGVSGRGAGAVLKDKNTFKVSSASLVTRMCKDGNAIAINKGKQWKN
jgi:hypothetical protein